MISQADYARHSGLSRSYISRLVSRGMPLDSLEAADRWRGCSARRRGKLLQSQVALPAPPTSDGQPSTPAEAFGRQRDLERAAHKLAREALKEGQPDAGRLVQVHAAAVANLARLRHDVLDLAEREGQLLSADWIKRVIIDHDGVLAAKVKTMPRQLAGRVAPHDAVNAEKELQLWVDDFLRAIYATRPWMEDVN